MPAEIEIAEGDTVVFKNNDTRERWPASNIHPTHAAYPGSSIEKCFTAEEAGIFDACKGLLTGEEYAFTFTEPGSWRYHDHLYPEETGLIEVLPDEHVDESVKEWSLSGALSEFFVDIKGKLQRLFYALFPGRLDERLAAVSIFEAAQDDVVLRDLLVVASPDEVMEKLLAESGGATTIRDCHQEAHRIGRIAYELYGAPTFEQGSAACHSGYYHGAMEAFLAEQGTANLEDDIKELCDIFKSNFGRFECLHGVGHGVMAYVNYDLPAALDECDKLGDAFSSESCYGGVFMENVVAGQGLGAIPGHSTEWVNREDPHFPCNALEGGGRRTQCYLMQTSWMMTLTGFNYPKVAEYCQAAPADMRATCFQSLGRDIAGNTLRDPAQINQLCAAVPEENGYFEKCITGAVNVIIDFWGPDLKDQAAEFCVTVRDSVRPVCDSIWQNRIHDLKAAS